jgi:hypothetical protein
MAYDPIEKATVLFGGNGSTHPSAALGCWGKAA